MTIPYSDIYKTYTWYNYLIKGNVYLFLPEIIFSFGSGSIWSKDIKIWWSEHWQEKIIQSTSVKVIYRSSATSILLILCSCLREWKHAYEDSGIRPFPAVRWYQIGSNIVSSEAMKISTSKAKLNQVFMNLSPNFLVQVFATSVNHFTPIALQTRDFPMR